MKQTLLLKQLRYMSRRANGSFRHEKFSHPCIAIAPNKFDSKLGCAKKYLRQS